MKWTKLRQENITKSYKRTTIETVNDINIEAKKIANELGIQGRATSFPMNQSFITLKDHKKNFENAPKCRLIKPAKSTIGRVNKEVLEK